MGRGVLVGAILGWFPANAAGRFFAFHFREQPHGKHHEEPEEGHKILNAIMAQRVLHVECDSRDNDNDQR